MNKRLNEKEIEQLKKEIERLKRELKRGEHEKEQIKNEFEEFKLKHAETVEELRKAMHLKPNLAVKKKGALKNGTKLTRDTLQNE